MLIAFRVENYRSLRDESELTMVVPSWVDPGGHAVVPMEPVSKLCLGSVAAIYGANASGKSNVLRALCRMRTAVEDSHQRWRPGSGVPYTPFFGDKSGGRSSTFEVEIYLDGQRYTYGYRNNSERILQEWLYSYSGSRRRVWFERDTESSEPFYFGKVLRGRPSVIAALTRDNSLFLSAATANNHPELGRIARWFVDSIWRVTPAERRSTGLGFTLRLLSRYEGERQRIKELLTFADLGIIDVEARTREIPDELRERLSAMFKTLDMRAEDIDATIEEAMQSAEFTHTYGANDRATLALADESEGTKSWLGLIGSILPVLDEGRVLLVDELDASLHPRLSSEIIRVFHDPELNKRGAQLIFNTHDPSLIGTLLESAPLRRDEVWLTEKDRCGVTHLYPLTEFKPRKAENLERGYLQGRYGGVPFLDRSHLLAGVSKSETQESDGQAD